MNPKLTIGMACYDDLNGVYMTVQSLRLHHREAIRHCELIVVDNNPNSKDGEMVRGLSVKVAGDFLRVRYLPSPEVVGTSAPRQKVFTEAIGDAVMCLDAHVLLPPGAVQSLLDYYAANPTTRDLLTGPMIYDDLGPDSFADHFRDLWRAEMWGVLSVTWRCPCGQLCSAKQVPPAHQGNPGDVAIGRCGLGDLFAVGNTTRNTCPQCVRGWPLFGWEGHEAKLRAEGFTLAAQHDEPFEIPAMGLGLFSCRREAWLGFNPEFRGFGGEEWYIHTKFRQAGAKCLCLPSLKWLHRFGRPGGVPYPLTAWNKMRNYVIGHRELGLDLEPIRQHFIVERKFHAHEWDQLVASDPPPIVPVAQPKPVAVTPVEPPRRPPEVPPAPTPKPSVKVEKGKPLPLAATIAEAFESARDTPADINEHCDTLRELAAHCETVTEFGCRYGVSTVAMLAGLPKRLRSYDINRTGEVNHLTRLAAESPTKFEFVTGSSLTVDIEPTDMLFIDTLHNAKQLGAELARHADKVQRWIVLHDTEIYGHNGDDGGPGLLVALEAFLKANPEWFIWQHYRNNYGLTVVSRDPLDRERTFLPPPPARPEPEGTPPKPKAKFDGAPLWKILHERALKYRPDNNGARGAEATWLHQFAFSLPCGECRQHWCVLAYELPPRLSSSEEYFAWSVEAHNRVNRMLDKPEVPLESALELWSPK